MHEALARQNFERDVAGLSPKYAEQAGWTIHSTAFPILEVTITHSTPVRLRFTCDSWDEQPPSIEILNPDGTPWTNSLPPGNVFHPHLHPVVGRIFICMRGSREFHGHPNHRNEVWDNYKGKPGMSLLGILQQLSRHWRRQMI